MLVDFNMLPNTSRVWIYQSSRSFSQVELDEITLNLNTFVENWHAHSKSLRAGYAIKYNRFIIIAVDQELNQASGCSIDTSVRFIQELERKYNIHLLDNLNVSYKHGDYIAYKPLADFKKMIKDKAITKNTIVFNNLVTNIDEINNNWEVPAKDSWHNRLF